MLSRLCGASLPELNGTDRRGGTSRPKGLDTPSQRSGLVFFLLEDDFSAVALPVRLRVKGG
jgi:hypothetical protein